MPRPTGGSSLGTGLGLRSDEDGLLVLAVAGAVLLTLLGSAGLYWAKASAWLVEHQVLVPAAARPWVSLPGGCGLDAARVVVVICVLAALVAVGISAIRHRQHRSGPQDQ